MPASYGCITGYLTGSKIGVRATARVHSEANSLDLLGRVCFKRTLPLAFSVSATHTRAKIVDLARKQPRSPTQLSI